nr:GNAT family N-acetyltransferase [Candidatus Sigynarchaeota archaeon]
MIDHGIEYRTCKPEEIGQVAEVFNVAFKAHQTAESFKKKFKNCDEPMYERQFVAVHDGKVVAGIRADFKPLYFADGSGGSLIKYDCGEINDVSTLPGHRGQGISRKLINIAITYMEQQKWSIALLQADPKYFARKLYESVGFKTLPSTGDIYAVALGNILAQFVHYPFVALLFPVLSAIAKYFAPIPPKSCLKLIKTSVPAFARRTRVFEPSQVTLVHVAGQIENKHPWCQRWRNLIDHTKDSVQGLHDDFLKAVDLRYDMNEPLPDSTMTWIRKIKPGRLFADETHRRHGYLLLQHFEGGMSGFITKPSAEIEADGILGGIHYTIDHFKEGKFQATLPMIDISWIAAKYQNQGLGTLMLARCQKYLGRTFPFMICRTSSGNVRYRKALKRAGFKEVGGGITMARPITDFNLYEKLASNVEPWVLY